MWPLFGVDLAAHLIAVEMFSNYVSIESGQDQPTLNGLSQIIFNTIMPK